MRTTKFWTVLTEKLITKQGGNVTTMSSEDGSVSPEQQVQGWLRDRASPGRCNSQISVWLNCKDPSVADGVVISSSANSLFTNSWAFLFGSEFTNKTMFRFFRKKRLFLQINQLAKKKKKRCSLLKHNKRAVRIRVRHIEKYQTLGETDNFPFTDRFWRYSPRSDKVLIHGTGRPCDYDIVMGKALREDKVSNTVYSEKME